MGTIAKLLLALTLCLPACAQSRRFMLMSQRAAGGLPDVTDYTARWTFDEGTGTSAADSSGNNFTAYCSNSQTWATGYIGPYCTSGGGTSWLDAGNHAALQIQTLSICYWINPGPSQLTLDYCGLLSHGKNGWAGAFYKINSICTFAKSYVADSGTSISAPTNTWTHVCFTCTDTAGTKKVCAYQNGVLVNSNSAWTTTFSFADAWNQHLSVAADPSDSANWKFNGKIDDVRIYNRALSAGEITTIYNWRP